MVPGLVKSGWNIVGVPPPGNQQFQNLLIQAASIGYRYKPVMLPLPRAISPVPPPTEQTVNDPSLLRTTDRISSRMAPEDFFSSLAQGSHSTASTLSGDRLAPQVKEYLQVNIPTMYTDYCKSLVFPNQGTHSTFAQVVFGRLVDEACKHMNPPLKYGFKNNGATKFEQLHGPAVSVNDIAMYMGNIAPKTFSNYKTVHLKALTSLKKLREKAREEPDSLSADANILFDHVKDLLTTPLDGLKSLDPEKYMSTTKFKKGVSLVFPKTASD